MSCQPLLLALVAVVVVLVRECQPYSMGAPDQACKRMTPGHGYDPQEGKPPVALELVKDDIQPGGDVSLKLVAEEGVTFKGFIVQARVTSDDESPIGNFEAPEASLMTCGKGIHNSVTHRNSNAKTSASFTWRAPLDFEGEVNFRYSVVVDYSRYWVNIDGSKVKVSVSGNQQPSSNEGQTSTSATTTTSQEVSSVSSEDNIEDEAEKQPINEGETAAETTTLKLPGRITLPTPAPTPTTTTTQRSSTEASIETVPTTHDIFKGCGNTKACFGMPVGCLNAGDCKVIVSYELSGDQMLFKMVGKSDGYLAVGLSDDNQMGDDLTTACFYNRNNGEIGYQTGFNVGYSNKPLHPHNLAISEFNGRYEDGLIECSFKRPSLFELAENGGKKYKLLEDRYVILLAEGPYRDGNLFKHRTKDSSSEPRALGIAENLDSKSKIYLKLHGSFMIGSWIFAGSLGILLARYFRLTWTSSKCCKMDLWFVFHRLMMVTTWLLTMAGFILIFAELEFKWTSVRIEDNPHAVLGCITTGLCFIQPFMALMRCHPGTPKRPIFNWLHWFVGNAAHILGIVAIFYAVDLDKAELPKETDFLLIAFVAFHFLMHLTLSLMMCVSDRQRKKSGKYHPNQYGNNGYPMHHMAYGQNRGMPVHPYPDYEELKGDAPGSGLRKFFLAVYILVAGLVAAALIALVVLAPSRRYLQDAGILQ